MNVSIHREKVCFYFLAGLFIVLAAVAVFTEEFVLMALPFTVLIFYAGWQNRNLVFLLLLFSIPFSFEYQFSSKLGSDIPDEGLMLYVTGLFIAYLVYSPKEITKNILQHPLLLILFISLGWIIFSVLFSTGQIVSIKYLLAKSWYIGAFVLAPLIIFKEKSFIKTAAIAIAGSMLIVAVIALVRHYNYGFRFAYINDAVYPFFRNHVNYSAMLVCIIPVLFAFFIAAKDKKWRIFTGGVIIVALLALVFSYARGAWLALLAGGITYWLIRKKLLFKAYVVSIIVLLASVFWLKKK